MMENTSLNRALLRVDLLGCGLAHPCPVCPAKAGEPCVIQGGLPTMDVDRVRRSLHGENCRKAQEAWDALFTGEELTGNPDDCLPGLETIRIKASRLIPRYLLDGETP